MEIPPPAFFFFFFSSNRVPASLFSLAMVCLVPGGFDHGLYAFSPLYLSNNFVLAVQAFKWTSPTALTFHGPLCG